MIDRKDIERLAELARIRVSSEELDALRAEIGPILEYVSQVNDLGGEALPEAGANRNVMRDDANPHEPGAYSDALLKASPDRQGDLFKVKKILSTDDSA